MKVTQLQWDADTVETMRPVVEASPWAGVAGLHDTLASAHLWEFSAGPRRLLMAVRGVECEHGRVLDVVGLRSLGDRIQAEELSAAVDQLARNAYGHVDLLSMATRRPHLVHGCERTGWHAVAYIVTKNLRLQ